MCLQIEDQVFFDFQHFWNFFLKSYYDVIEEPTF